VREGLEKAMMKALNIRRHELEMNLTAIAFRRMTARELADSDGLSMKMDFAVTMGLNSLEESLQQGQELFENLEWIIHNPSFFADGIREEMLLLGLEVDLGINILVFQSSEVEVSKPDGTLVIVTQPTTSPNPDDTYDQDGCPQNYAVGMAWLVIFRYLWSASS